MKTTLEASKKKKSWKNFLSLLNFFFFGAEGFSRQNSGKRNFGLAWTRVAVVGGGGGEVNIPLLQPLFFLFVLQNYILNVLTRFV